MLLELNNAWTLVVALLSIELGKFLTARFQFLSKGNIPPSVSAGLVLSLVLALFREMGWVDLHMAERPRDVLLLVFFASLGFSAHLGKLASAGKGALVVCVAVLVAILGQDLVGIAVAKAFGEPAALGLFCGSISYLGGHGTAVAWASSVFAKEIDGAFEVGVGCATMGLVLGGVVSGPIAMWLSTKKVEAAKHATVFDADEPPATPREPKFDSSRWLLALLWVLACVAAGPVLREWVAANLLALPPFLIVMLVGVLITNVSDVVRRPVDTEVTDLIGTIALRLFLSIAMLSLDWGALASQLPLVLTASLVQVGCMAMVAIFIIYVAFGRGGEGATAAGGFLGFALGAMPVGLATIKQLQKSIGEYPRAILALTLAASLFTDTANALILTGIFKFLH